MIYYVVNRNGGGVDCYVRNDLSYAQKNLFPNVIENVFFEIRLPKTKPITAGIDNSDFQNKLSMNIFRNLTKSLTFLAISI